MAPIMAPSRSLSPENVGLWEGTEHQQLSIKANLGNKAIYLYPDMAYLFNKLTFHPCNHRDVSCDDPDAVAAEDRQVKLRDTAFLPAW